MTSIEKSAQAILEAVGGTENIDSLVHCSTRLRFMLKKEDQVDDQVVGNIPGVLSIARAGGQYQIVIGTNVADYYDEIMKIGNLDQDSSGSSSQPKIHNIADAANAVIKVITGTISPVIPIMAGAGMGKVLLLVLSLTGVLSEKSQSYQMINLIFDTGFFFLPGFVGFSAAKIFGANQYLGGFIGLATLHPVWTGMVAAANPVSLFGLNVQLISYSSQIIPTLLAVWLMSYVEKYVKKITPQSIAVFFEPMMVMLITAPLTFLFIGPAGNVISQGIANSSLWLYNNAGWIAIPILAALYPWLVSMGIHKALSPISISLVASQGFDPIIRVVALCSNIAQGAASLAVGLKTKNKHLRSLALSSALTAYLGGITEPALYGVNLKLKKPMYGAMIGAGIAGVAAGVMKLKAFIYVTPALLSMPMWVSKSENFIPQAMITLLISSVATFIATWIIGFDDPVDEVDQKTTPQQDLTDGLVLAGAEPSPNTDTGMSTATEPVTKLDQTVKLSSPVSGETAPLSSVADQTFASGVMGNGIAIIPTKNKIIAPADAKVVATFETGHAIGLDLPEGIELLIHIGIDTVSLKGQYFKNLVSKGELVKKGQPLIEFDLDKIRAAGYDPTVMLVVTNSRQLASVQPIGPAQVGVDDSIVAIS